MNEEKKDFWKLVFIIIPATLFGSIANLFDENNLAYSAIFTALGVVLGFLLHHLSRNKSKGIKIACMSLLLTIPFSSIIYKSQTKKEWITQKIDDIQFSSPYKTELIDSKIPEDLKEDYNKLEIYNDGKDKRTTIIYSIQVKDADFDLESYFDLYLESFKTGISDIKTIDKIKEIENENVFSAKLKFIKTDNNTLNGFCKLIKKGKDIYILWLIPLSETYSEKEINKFKNNISE